MKKFIPIAAIALVAFSVSAKGLSTAPDGSPRQWVPSEVPAEPDFSTTPLHIPQYNVGDHRMETIANINRINRQQSYARSRQIATTFDMGFRDKRPAIKQQESMHPGLEKAIKCVQKKLEAHPLLAGVKLYNPADYGITFGLQKIEFNSAAGWHIKGARVAKLTNYASLGPNQPGEFGIGVLTVFGFFLTSEETAELSSSIVATCGKQ